MDCPCCGEGKLIPREYVLVYNPREGSRRCGLQVVRMKGHYCPTCGADLTTAEDAKFNACGWAPEPGEYVKEDFSEN